MKYFRYHNTNCFFVAGKSEKLMAFDAGWPRTLFGYARMMKTIGLRLENLAWAIVSHMHMDHAGLLGEFIQLGIDCYVTAEQYKKVDEMERIILKSGEYREYKKIDKSRLHIKTIEELNEVLRNIGVDGEALMTPGHSQDSLSYITKELEALIGDLYPKEQLMLDNGESFASWDSLARRGVKRAFPSHAGTIEL